MNSGQFSHEKKINRGQVFLFSEICPACTWDGLSSVEKHWGLYI